MFSPNGRKIASASFDKSVKVWDGKTGKFVSTLRGHVRAVYQVSWSADGKLLVSGSSDSTVKVRLSLKARWGCYFLFGIFGTNNTGETVVLV